MEISVIIPTLNAEHEIDGLLIALEHQSIQPVDILIADSASEDKTIELVRQHKRVRLLKIDRQDFNHGTTRDMALRSRGVTLYASLPKMLCLFLMITWSGLLLPWLMIPILLS